MAQTQFEELKIRAEQGDVEAQFELGYGLIHGEAETVNYSEASELFCKAALRGREDALVELFTLGMVGQIPAQYWLGQYYARVNKGKRDYNEAARWYSMAVERNAFLISEGRTDETGCAGTCYDTKALEDLIQLANRDISDAQLYLGLLYDSGTGVPQDSEVAQMWFEKSKASQRKTVDVTRVAEPSRTYSGGLNRPGQIGLAFVVREQTSDYVMPQEDVDRIKKEVKKEEDYRGMLYRFIDKQGRDHVEVYHSAWLKKNNWNTLIKGDSIPVVETFMALAVSLKMNINEAEELLKKAGYAFNPKSVRDNIVREYIINERYDIAGINSTLVKNGFKIKQLLGTDIEE